MADGGQTAADLGAWICFEDEAGQGLRPPKATTWGRRGRTPVVRVTSRGTHRVSLAALVAVKPGRRPRLIYRTHAYHGRKHEKKGLDEGDYIRLLDAAHQQLGAPIVLVWDNLNAHRSARMRRYIAARDWLTVFHLPPYAPELNPVEGIWSHLKRSLANLAKHTIDQLMRLIKTRLKRIQHRPNLLNGLLAHTHLPLW
ncbi:transposase [Actinomadura sp. KC345]|uniref:transposase n=1 Tax=Actinomadura sp. KC345 TaxID=2530371 RepID=UPI001405004E|nr:transposase [Actinomadura sp. KC345]